MSKWRKALKNKRKFDARYFLNERVENQEVVENSVQQEEVKRSFNDFSFDSWLTEAEESLDESHCGSHKRDDEEELEEAAKPDFLDLDKDGDKKEPMKDAADDAEELEEIVGPQGASPDSFPSKKIDGMSPGQIRMTKAKAKAKKAREDAKKKGLGPVVDEG